MSICKLSTKFARVVEILCELVDSGRLFYLYSYSIHGFQVHAGNVMNQLQANHPAASVMVPACLRKDGKVVLAKHAANSA